MNGFTMISDRDTLLKMPSEELLKLCKIDCIKGSGPGGQKRNKTSSAVVLTMSELDISVSDCTERSQFRNRENALKKLKFAIALKLRQQPPPEGICNPLCSIKSDHYPLFAAQLLDFLHDSGFDHKCAAEKCGLTPSAMLKKIHRDPQLWQFVQNQRRSSGRPPLSPP